MGFVKWNIYEQDKHVSVLCDNTVNVPTTYMNQGMTLTFDLQNVHQVISKG